MNNKQKTSWGIIVAFVLVPLIVSVVSTIHVISFFLLSNDSLLALVLAIAFEIGALSALAGLIVMDKINKSTVWFIFILLTLFQMMGNAYYSYDTVSFKIISNNGLIKNFSELFGLDNSDAEGIVFIKRIIAILSGAILPIISLSFLHLLIRYISFKPEFQIENNADINISSDIDNKLHSEEIIELNAIPKNSENNFNVFLDNKKKELEEKRVSYSELLRILFKDGSIKEGEELPSYKDFVNMIEKGKFSNGYLKLFLTLLNFLSIAKAAGDIKIALKSYEEAKTILEDYLSFNS